MSLRSVWPSSKKKLDYAHRWRVLPYGATLVEVDQPHLHRGSIAVFLRAGSRYETAFNNGLSHFLEHMIFRGTKAHPSAYELNLAIEQLGGTLFAATAPDSTEFELTLPKDCMESGVRLLAEILTEPVFRDIEIERRVIIEEIKEELDEREQSIDLDFLSRSRLWPHHPLGRSVAGPLTNARRFAESDIRQHWLDSYVAQNAVICLSGAFDASRLAPVIEEEFSRLPAERARQITTRPQLGAGPTTFHARRPGSQTDLRLACLAFGTNDPDRVALGVLLGVLDDGMSTRLHRRIFDELGLAYDVSADLELYADTGALNIDVTTSHDNAPEVVRHLGQLIAELKTRPIGDTELDKAKRREIWALESFLDSPQAMSIWFGEQELSCRPVSLEQRIEQVLAVERSDLERVASRVFERKNLHLTTVGLQDAAACRALEQALRENY